MKRNILHLAGALLSSAILMFGCSEDIPTYNELTVDKTEVFIQADGENPTATVNITEGNDNYKISVADENIATATIDGARIIINGLKNGTTTATVIDWTKHSTVITIKVKEDFELKLDKEEVTLFLDEESQKTTLVNIISGNGDYQVESSNDEVATAELNKEGKVLITGVSSDFCDITVTDADGNKTTVKVGVCNAHLILEDITGKVCIANQTMDIGIISGNGEYTITNENQEIVSAEIVEGVLKVTGLSKGEANITVVDRMKQTANIKITVVIEPSIEITHIDNLWVGEEPQEIIIMDGSKDYTVDAGEAIDYSFSDDKSTLFIKGKDGKVAFDQTIKITDNIFNKTLEISVGEINYQFETYGTARWYVEGSYQIGISKSTIDTDGAREHIKVGTSTWIGKPANGYHISFEGGRGVGKKTSPSSLVKINNRAAESNICSITDLEIVKREYTNDSDETNGKGKFWIRFKEEGKEEYSYIITWF